MTILSRCQRFEFRRLTNPQIVARLEHILKEENLKLTEEALRTLAAYGDGSLRDSLSLLDQVLSYYSHGEGTRSALDEKQVVEALGLSDSSTVVAFLAAILKKDTPGILKIVGDTYQSGVDLKRFAERCLEELRLVVLARRFEGRLREAFGRVARYLVEPFQRGRRSVGECFARSGRADVSDFGERPFSRSAGAVFLGMFSRWPAFGCRSSISWSRLRNRF